MTSMAMQCRCVPVWIKKNPPLGGFGWKAARAPTAETFKDEATMVNSRHNPRVMILTTNAISMHGRKTYLQDYKVAAVHMRLQTQQKLARPRLEQLRDL
jgi:hypothetical protein